MVASRTCTRFQQRDSRGSKTGPWKGAESGPLKGEGSQSIIEYNDLPPAAVIIKRPIHMEFRVRGARCEVRVAEVRV